KTKLAMMLSVGLGLCDGGIDCVCARASFSVARQITCGLIMVRIVRPCSLAAAFILALCGGKASQALTGSAPAGLVTKMKSEWRTAYASPALEEAALTRMQRPLIGFGETKAFLVFQNRPSIVSSPSSSQSRSRMVVNSF